MREDEVISTIFVVGFPDDMLVSGLLDALQSELTCRKENSRTSSPSHRASKPPRSSSPPARQVAHVNPPRLCSRNSPKSPRLNKQQRNKQPRPENTSISLCNQTSKRLSQLFS